MLPPLSNDPSSFWNTGFSSLEKELGTLGYIASSQLRAKTDPVLAQTIHNLENTAVNSVEIRND